MKRIAIFFILLTILAACSSAEDDPTPAPEPTPLVTTTPNAFPADDRLAIEADYEIMRQFHVEISGIWESLSRGETAQCGTSFELLPSRASLSGYGEISDHLLRAASELRAAANRWEAECANPRENIPQETIEGGLLEVRAAGDALREVEEFLAEN